MLRWDSHLKAAALEAISALVCSDVCSGYTIAKKQGVNSKVTIGERQSFNSLHGGTRGSW